MKSFLPVLLAAGMVALAQAADPPSAKPAANPAAKAKSERAFGSAAKGPLLTRAELRACLSQQDRIRTEQDTLARDRSAREAEMASLRASGETLKAELAALDRANAEAVEQYNAKAQARDRAVDAFQAGAAAYNEKAQALEVQRQSFTQSCANRRYDEADEIAIGSGR